MSKSIYSEPCPSPNGTNYERLYIIRKPAIMALDAAPKYGIADDYPDDVNDNPGGTDTEDQVRQLLEGKLSPEDLDALCDLIFPDDSAAPMPAADRKRRMGRDQRLVMPSKAEILRRVAASGEIRAARAEKQYSDLCRRFPALKHARVGG
jgi:hypothetical protein